MSTQQQQPEEVQVLEFKLGDETYCVDIDFVSEIVDMTELTEIPNSPHYVEGVMDLRGKTTAVVNPKTVLGIPNDTPQKRIIIFDANKSNDSGTIGWAVDEVYQVVRVSVDDVDRTPFVNENAVRGVVKREDKLVVWINPDVVNV